MALPRLYKVHLNISPHFLETPLKKLWWPLIPRLHNTELVKHHVNNYHIKIMTVKLISCASLPNIFQRTFALKTNICKDNTWEKL